MNTPTTQSVGQFFNWLRGSFPQIYGAVKARGAPLAAIDLGNLLDNVKDVASAYLQYDAQKDLLKLQLERARAGLPPLDSSQYAPTINAGLAPATQGAVTQWILIAGAILVGVMLLKR